MRRPHGVRWQSDSDDTALARTRDSRTSNSPSADREGRPARFTSILHPQPHRPLFALAQARCDRQLLTREIMHAIYNPLVFKFNTINNFIDQTGALRFGPQWNDV